MTYGRWHDISYRSGMIVQVFGLCLLAVLYPLANPFYTLGIMLFEAGVLLSALFLLVWAGWIKKIVLGSVLIGIPLQVAGNFTQPEYAVPIMILGLGLVCVGAAGMAGKEAYCFALREGWILMWMYPVVILINLIAAGHRVVNSLAFSSLFLLMLSLMGRKMNQPLVVACAADANDGWGGKREDI